MLRADQEIIYRKNRIEILSRITNENFDDFALETKNDMRFRQPLLKEGQQLFYPQENEGKFSIMRSSTIKKREREGNRIGFETISGSFYVIDYVGIDLDKVIEELGDLTSSSGTFIPYFPQLLAADSDNHDLPP